MMKKILIVLLLFFLLVVPCQAKNIWLSKPPLGSQIDWGNPLSRGLVGCWLMNEGGGRTLRNLVYPDCPAVLNNDAVSKESWQPRKFGTTVYYDDTADDQVTFSSVVNEIFYRFTSSFTVSFLVNNSTTTPVGFCGLIGKYKGTADGWDIGISNGKLDVDLRGTSSISAFEQGADLRDGKYHLVSIVCKNTGITIYTDGKLISTRSKTWTATTNTTPLCFGNRGNQGLNQGMIGSLDDILIHNRALTFPEIQSLYQDRYQMIKPSTWWYSVVSGVTTSVTQTYTNLRNAVFRDSAMR